jgi:general secretion pathway protein G
MTRRRPPRGFTLVELVVTVTIIAILASVALPFAELAVQRAKEQDLRSALREIRGAIDTYKQAADQGRIKKSLEQTGYPPDLNVLVQGVEDQKDPKKARIFFLRRLPRDPFADPQLTPAESWGKRSYESPPDAPKEGTDVFDVYPLSSGVGLNGVPYKDW